jgi:hypothetical protein
MKLFILILISFSAFADSDPLFTTVTLQERMGNVYRHEVVSSWPHCIEHKKAEKTYLHKTNELREIAIWDKDGKVRGAGRNNNPALHKEINAIFARSQRGNNPCVKPEVKPVVKPEEKPEEKTPVEPEEPEQTPVQLDPGTILQ